jgi:hypothetical protein
MEDIYAVRFWNAANECLPVFGSDLCYSDYAFDAHTFEQAWEIAYAWVEKAHDMGATEMTINNYRYPILED